MEEKTIDKVLKELLTKTREKKKETKDKTLEGTNNGSSLWAIVTALRGPDTYEKDELLKRLTTARVRGILGLENGSVEVRYDPLDDEEIVQRNTILEKREKDSLGWIGDHFANHFKHAIYGLKKLGYDVPEKELSF